ncbi:MAG: DUF4105 domain-containing protein [Candidatus Rifleibacteriota bacterium]
MKKIVLLLALVVALPSFVGAGVFYRVNGIIDIQENFVVLTTDDCRVFQLDMSRSKAAQFDGKIVQVDAVAKDSTKLRKLKVKKIRPFKKRILIKDNRDYKNHQKSANFVKATKSEIIIGNVRWARKNPDKKDLPRSQAEFHWRKVKIKPELIDEIYFVKLPFPPEWIAAHCLMLYTFKDGGLVDNQGNKSTGLVLSIEAYQTKDQKYSLTEGLKKAFGIVWILATWENYAAETCYYDNKKMVPYPVKFNHRQKVALLKETLKQSLVNRKGEYYHTTRNNCTNNLVILLDKISKTKIRYWTIPSMIYNVRATMPTMVPRYLQKKGLIEKEKQEINEKNFFVDPRKLLK